MSIFTTLLIFILHSFYVPDRYHSRILPGTIIVISLIKRKKDTVLLFEESIKNIKNSNGDSNG